MKNFLFFLLLFAAIVFSNGRCAKVGSLTGGEKDTLAPMILAETPDNYTVNYRGTKFRGIVKFNEFIQLKKLEEQFYVSPIQQEKAEIKVKGKKLVMLLKDTLRENTTYTLNFGDAVCDYNEGNPHSNYTYVFSTGAVIDTLSVRGRLLDAFSMSKRPNTWVMLYRNETYNDSTPLKDVPDFVGKTDTAGYFVIPYIKEGGYRIFALDEKVNNFKFDSKKESIAFLGDVITPSAIEVVVNDTIVKTKEDSTTYKAVFPRTYIRFLPDSLQLLMFTEETDEQKLMENKRASAMQLAFVFRLPLYNDSIGIALTDTLITHRNWWVEERNATKDSISFWLTDSTLIKRDTLHIALTYWVKDSTKAIVPQTDSLRMLFKEKKVAVNNRKKDKQAAAPSLYTLQMRAQPANRIELNSDLQLLAPAPLRHADVSKIKFYELKDTLQVPVDVEFYRDTFNVRTYHLRAKWAEESRYRLFVDTLAFVDYLGNANDTIDMTFQTPAIDSYLTVGLNCLYTNAFDGILQLLNGKDVPLREVHLKPSPEKQKIVFDYLKEGTYKLKIIIDSNGNGKWDTGNYLQNLQPEQVVPYKSEIKLNEKWSSELEWTVE